MTYFSGHHVRFNKSRKLLIFFFFINKAIDLRLSTVQVIPVLIQVNFFLVAVKRDIYCGKQK